MASFATKHETHKNTTMVGQMKLTQNKFQFKDLVMVVQIIQYSTTLVPNWMCLYQEHLDNMEIK